MEISGVRSSSAGDARRRYPPSGRVAQLVAVLVLVVVACSGNGGTVVTTLPASSTPSTTIETTTSGPTETSSTTAAAPPVGDTVELATGELGSYLVDGAGNTLYLFLDDAQGSSTCYGTCAVSWPPFTGEVTAGPGVEAALLGTEARTDGTGQVTYQGWPLYYFSGDQSPGDVNGQGRGSSWFVVDVAGRPIGQAG